MKTRFMVIIAFFTAVTLVGIASLSADSPTTDQLKTADAARVAFEKSGLDAAAAVVDDGFMSAPELAEKKAEARAAGDPDIKADWDAARRDLENTAWSIEPADIKVTIGVWDRDKKQWPLTIASQNMNLPVVLNLVWNIASNSDPKAFYDSVNAQLTAKTLAARLNYSLSWQAGTAWRETLESVDILGKHDTQFVIDSLTIKPFYRWDLDATNPAKVVKDSIVDLVAVKGGYFVIDKQQVTVSSFRIGRTDVTQLLFDAVMGTTLHEEDKDPMVGVEVSWDAAVDFCNKLSLLEGLNPVYSKRKANFKANGYRLPTEAEWEYASRGGAKSAGTIYVVSENVDSEWCGDLEGGYAVSRGGFGGMNEGNRNLLGLANAYQHVGFRVVRRP